MSRAPYQVLVFPYFITDGNEILFALFKRENERYWQGIAGGGEEEETPIQSARREAFEEAGIDFDNPDYITLMSTATIPVTSISGFAWGEDVFVIPEYSFGVELKNKTLKLSKEHLEYKWMSFDEATKTLKWDSNKSALWELNHRIVNDKKDISANLNIIDKHRKYI